MLVNLKGWRIHSLERHSFWGVRLHTQKSRGSENPRRFNFAYLNRD